MIIYFNFDTNQLEFFTQQNSEKYFAVNFLCENAKLKRFDKIITDVLENNKQIVTLLKKEKTIVVLPDEVVGYGCLEVPNSRFKSKQFFNTKFNLIYNKNNDITVISKVFSLNKNSKKYCFCALKTNIITQIINTFEKFGLRVAGITYYAKVLCDRLLSYKKELIKDNFIILQHETKLKLFAVSYGQVLGRKILDLFDENTFAKKFVEYSTGKKSKSISENLENGIKKIKIKKSSVSDENKITFALEDFNSYFKNEPYNINLEKIITFNLPQNFSQYKYCVVIDELTKENIFSMVKNGYFYPIKRGLL